MYAVKRTVHDRRKGERRIFLLQHFLKTVAQHSADHLRGKSEYEIIHRRFSVGRYNLSFKSDHHVVVRKLLVGGYGNNRFIVVRYLFIDPFGRIFRLGNAAEEVFYFLLDLLRIDVSHDNDSL